MLRRMSVGKRLALTLLGGMALVVLACAIGNRPIALGILPLAGLASYYVIRSITQPITAATTVAEPTAGGDLRATIEAPRASDEPGRLLVAMWRMNEQLCRIMGEIRAGAASRPAGRSRQRRGMAGIVKGG